MKKIILVVGRTCSGKSSAVREVCSKLGLKQVKSFTTRPMRPGEDVNSDHYFISEKDVESYRNKIIAWTEIKGYQYFTTSDELDESDFYVIDPNGINYLKPVAGRKYQFVIVYIRATEKQRSFRSYERGDDVNEFIERCKSEDEQFSDFEHNMVWDYHIINDGEFSDLVLKLESIARKELM